MKLFALLLLAALACAMATPAPAAERRILKVEDLFRFQRVADPQLSPDGRWVVYVVTSVNLEENKSSANLWLAAVDGKSPPRRLTTTDKRDSHPRWRPDGTQILFESTRSGESQLWVIDVAGGEARQLTTLATEASNAIWSPDGKHIAFVSAVYPEYSTRPFADSDAANKKRKEEIAKNPVKARVFTRLFFRHWDSWVEDKRQHLFVMSSEGGAPRDVTPGDRDAYPTSSTFSVGDDFTFSPDGQFLVFTAVPVKNEAWNTDFSLCRVPITGGGTDWECLTDANAAADSAPRYSPDGKWLAYRAQKKPMYEADKWELLLAPAHRDGRLAGPARSLTADLDRSVDGFGWHGNEALRFLAEENATLPIWEVNTSAKPAVRKIVAGFQHGSLSIAQGGLTFTRAAMHHPAEVFVKTDDNAEPRNLSQANSTLLDSLDLPRPESVTVPGAGATPMQMWILKPPGFNPQQKWPLIYMVHGGPQGAWEDGWSFRWNPEIWAAQGYVVALPNPRGSTGFGQRYVEEISGDWGGKCFEDLLAGVDYLEKQPYIDTNRMVGAGASFGGYMMNWFQAKTTKFKTLVTHCGVFNFDSMYATTEELWFDEWEHGGPPWGKNRHSYEKHSPHRYAADFRTPMLIIHNDNDFRVPISEGIQLFTTLQRLGIPSKMINFPDEGHWVLKPANSAYWHREIFSWIKQYATPGGR